MKAPFVFAFALVLATSAFCVAADRKKGAHHQVCEPPLLALRVVHPQKANSIPKVKERALLAPAGYKLFSLPVRDLDGNKTDETTPILLSHNLIVDQNQVERGIIDPISKTRIIIRLNKAGGARLKNFTKNMEHGVDRIAVCVEGNALIAPIVQSQLDRDFVITGLDSSEEAKRIAHALASPTKSLQPRARPTKK